MADDVGGLYPFLSGGGPSDAERHEAVVTAVRSKARASARLRADVLAAEGERLARCAAALRHTGRRFCLGNGGSAADAGVAASLLDAHDLTRPTTVVTALANDVGFDQVFARQLRAQGHRGDGVVAFSTSGTSPNVVEALVAARAMGMVTIALVGTVPDEQVGFVQADHLFTVSSDSVHRVQEVHMALIGELAALCAT